jgi:hypothetical protein
MFGNAISGLLSAVDGGGGGGIFGDILGGIMDVGSFLFFHEGGPIYAHKGWPGLKRDEVPIIAQTGERVLSREQNKAYESGGGAAPVVYSPTYHIQAIDARGVESVLKQHGKAMVGIINKEINSRNQKLGSGRY